MQTAPSGPSSAALDARRRVFLALAIAAACGVVAVAASYDGAALDALEAAWEDLRERGPVPEPDLAGVL